MNGKSDIYDSSEQQTPQGDVTKESVRETLKLRSRLIATFVCCALLAIVVVLIGPAVHWLRQANQRMECGSNLRQIGIALGNYHDVHGSFPPAIIYADDGTALHSWRLLLAPFVICNPVYDAYMDARHEPWNSPRHKFLIDETPDEWGQPTGTRLYDAEYFCYRCPSAPDSQGRMCTNYVMLIDDRPGQPNAAPTWPGSEPPKRDPPSRIIVIEIVDSDIHWMEPRDVLLSELSLKINDPSKPSISSHHGGACVLRADGSVLVLDDSETAEHLQDLLTP
ncbi:MAG: DUF1559 domain-containing protein [Pirellulaceae bacterium]